VTDLTRVYCELALGELDKDYALLGMGPPTAQAVAAAIEAA
jgi:hypothetical protein